MENEMVERVASGMLGCPVQNLPNKEDRAYWRRNARAAIEAMREPTAAMLQRAYSLHRDDTSWDNSTAPPRLVHKLGRAGPGDDYRAMIDAALSPPSLPAHKE